jgi:hypothetical protein
MAESAVVASSASRSFVMCFGSCGILEGVAKFSSLKNAGDQQTGVGPDCGGFQMGMRIYFGSDTIRARRCSWRIQKVISDRKIESRRRALRSRLQMLVGAGGEPGPGDPGIGNSSGISPGSSSGRDGSPGSCTGGGISGLGFPGGSSRGGSVGCPGWIGGSSVGSIGIAARHSVSH